MTFLDLDESGLSRAGALHTAREIAQQPRSWLRTESLLNGLSGRIEEFVHPLTAGADSRLILTGAGSSSFIGEALAPLLLQQLDRRVEAIATTDLLAAPYLYLQQNVPTLLVSFGRSGNSPESAAVVDLASRLVPKCRHLVLTCNEHGTLHQRFRDRDDSLVILLPTETHDQGFAMTSSFTSMLLAAWLIFRRSDEAPPVAAIARAGELLLSQHGAALRDLAACKFSRVVYLGSGCFKGLAREAALKLLEMTDGQIVASSDSALGFRHGPKAIVNNDTLVFVFVSNDSYTRRYDLDLLRELRSEGRAGRVVAVTAQTSDAAIGTEFLSISGLETAQDASLLFPYIVCAQLYAFHRSLALGNSPDEPIMSGTVNRVVRGVTVHSL
jgi:tagatose-6-phosphate ketose/aldose isomerase